jgi:uncharacterized membrane protein YkoI
MFQTARKTLMMLAALAAFAAGGATLAGAATNSSSSSSSPSTERPQRPQETELSGDTAAKVKAAALAKVPGGTVLRAETGEHHGSAYEAHVRKSDGTEVAVLVNKSFEATAVETRRRGGPGGPRGPGGGPRGGRGPGETALTGDTAAKVKAAALAKVSGGTVLRVETDAQHGSAYEAHVRKSDGTEVEVLVNKQFEVTAVDEMQRP